ncbi:stalk domain-containing protein [Desulforudis sp. 1088]
MPPGRTFVPLRFVSETLGAVVDYDPVTRQITITR